MTDRTSLAYALELDRQDELALYRARFLIQDAELIYLDGNSLGRLPESTLRSMQTLIADEWGVRLIDSWNAGWWSAPERIGAKIAQIVGAQPDELIIADSTSVNLFKLAVAALRARPHRAKIVTDDLNFPSDVYILQAAVKFAGPAHHLEVIRSADGIHGPVEALEQAIDEDTALVSLSHTVFKSSYTYDMAAINALAHQAGAMVLWDLSHSAGSVICELTGTRADLAVGCTYKYLNGGPGSPAFLYVRRELQEQLDNPITGWMGQKQAFDFDLKYSPAPGLRRFLSGTPPILSMSAIEPGVDLILEAGMDRLRAKSVQQTEYLISLFDPLLAPLGFRLNSPRQPDQRGSHVSIGHDEGWRIDQALIHEMKVVPDFRKPDSIRFGIAPLYTSYQDIHAAVTRLRRVVTGRLYEKYSSGEGEVT